MPGPSYRDRFFTPKVWRALSSPWSLLLLVVVAVVAAVAGLPLVAAGLVGLAAYAVRVLAAVPGGAGPRPERIDPFTVQEPWRRFVQQALQTRNRFDELVHGMADGPLRDNLSDVARRVNDAVAENYRIAQRGQALAKARRTIDVGRIERQQAELSAGDPTDASLEQVTAALEAQRSAAARLDQVQAEAQARLRLLDARMSETLARAVELSAQPSAGLGAGTGVDALGTDVDSLVSDMEALRQALEEVHGVGGGLSSPGGAT